MIDKQLINLLLVKNIDDTKINIEEYNIRINRLQALKDLELKNKPPKYLKNKYKKWQKKINKINKDILDIYSKIENELDMICENIKVIKDE